MYSHVDLFFFFNDTATTEIYTLSLHDALPILTPGMRRTDPQPNRAQTTSSAAPASDPRVSRTRSPLVSSLSSDSAVPNQSSEDRKSTRLNSSHANISYAVFCLKKKNNKPIKRT